MARQTLHLFGCSISDGGSSPYDGAGTEQSQTRFFICDRVDDLPESPGDLDFALVKDENYLLFGNNRTWVKLAKQEEA